MSLKIAEGQWSVTVQDASEKSAFRAVRWRRSILSASRPGTEDDEIRAYVELAGRGGPSSIAALGGA